MGNFKVDLNSVNTGENFFKKTSELFNFMEIPLKYMNEEFEINENGNYPCPLHEGGDRNFQADFDKNIFTCHSHSCVRGGDIIEVVKVHRNLEKRYHAMKYLADRYDIDLPDQEKQCAYNRADLSNTIEYYENKKNGALESGDIELALEISSEQEEATVNNFIQFPFVNKKGNPLPIWENVNAIVQKYNYVIAANEITKRIEVNNCKDTNAAVMEIHSKCNINGLSVGLEFVGRSLSHIANEYSVNPVTDFLMDAYMGWEGNKGAVDMLCDALITDTDTDNTLKRHLVKTWLVNTANIAFNTGYANTEGILVLKGKQGLGKTRLVRKLLSNNLQDYVKTGKNLDLKSKDSILESTSYWIVELGEFGGITKKQVNELKQFITEPVDELRAPYAKDAKRYPRKTSFIASVNDDTFLSDETGNRRYWTISLDSINFDIIDNIDMTALWGEVMHLLKTGEVTTWLDSEHIEIVNNNNELFRHKTNKEAKIDNYFEWDADIRKYRKYSSADLMLLLELKTNKGLKTMLEKKGAATYRTNKERGYILPPLKKEYEHLL
ncbi:MAG: VapE domain-containing protein [Paraclostridium sp.]